MSGLSAERRDELAGALCRGLGDAVCLNYDPSVPGGCSRCARDVNALAPLIAGWLAAEFCRGGREGREAGLLAGAAEARARIEALIPAFEADYGIQSSPVARLRAALRGDS